MTLAVYDVQGRRVTLLADGFHRAGTHALTWNGKDGRGQAVGAGVYFLRLESGGSVASRKMVLVK